MSISHRERGCSQDELESVRQIGREHIAKGGSKATTPIGAFAVHKRNARQRGIEWRLTFWQWWTIWQESGKWEQRGSRSADYASSYVMCRKGDVGPYAVGNVYIETVWHNNTVQPIHGRGRWKHVGVPRGVDIRPNGYGARIRIGGRIRYLGIFSTQEEAHAAYLTSLAARQRELSVSSHEVSSCLN